jgi:hypothetical protein
MTLLDRGFDNYDDDNRFKTKNNLNDCLGAIKGSVQPEMVANGTKKATATNRWFGCGN